MEEERTKAGELYAKINQRTKELGGNLLPSEIILGSMVEVINSCDFAETSDGKKAIVFSDTAAMAFVAVLDSMTAIYDSDRFKEFGRVAKENVESSPGLKSEYLKFKRVMNGTDENTSIGFDR